MTIISFGDKLKKPGEEPLVAAEHTANASVDGKDVEVGVRTAALRITTSRKSHTLITLASFVVAVMVMGVGIYAGLRCYQYLSSKPIFIPIQRIRGMLSMSGSDSENQQYLTFDHISASPRQKFTVDTHHGLVTEDIDTHPNYERLEVPSFNGSNRGVFVHDFEANLTAIVDTHNCYVMPLNRNQVMPPASLADFLIKNNQGYYDVDTDVVRETMRVVLPAVMSSFDFGVPIMRECFGKRVYQLEKDTSRVQKRSAGESALFRTYAGKPMEVAIVNYKEALESDS